MSQIKPFKRTVRQLSDGSYSNSGNARYINHPNYANSPERFIQSYLLILKDVRQLFEYVEPSQMNKRTYSYRIHELFIRTSIEVEANFKAILLENGYTKKGNLNISDYELVNTTHKLSDYKLEAVRWIGTGARFIPFRKWSDNPKDPWWWNYYNDVKHDIHSNFQHANLKNLMEAVSGLTALISAQFYDEDFNPAPGSLLLNDGGPGNGYDIMSVGGMFRVKYPEWSEEERYAFEWQEIKDDQNIFQKHDYNKLKKKRDEELKKSNTKS